MISIKEGLQHSFLARPLHERTFPAQPRSIRDMRMKTYHAPNSGILAYAEGKDYIILQFKTGERYRYDSHKPGRKHVNEMKSRARRTSGLTTYVNQHVRANYAKKLGPPRAPRSSLRKRSTGK